MIGRGRRSRGFTVAELIVAMSISAITLLSGYELFQALKDVGDDQSADLSATAEIAHGLDRIREDLLHALPRIGSSEPIFAGGDPTFEGQAPTTKLLEFYTLAAAGGDDRCGSLRQIHRVGYELVSTEDSLCLYRTAAPVVGAHRTPVDEVRELILDGIEEVRIAFHDGPTAEPRFSSNERLPTGVELTVTAHGQIWPLCVRLPCGSEGQH